MNNTIFLEIFGYIGTALVIVSMMMSSLKWLRIFNMSGSFINTVYAVCVQAWPVVLLNATLLVINAIKLIADKRERKKGEKA